VGSKVCLRPTDQRTDPSVHHRLMHRHPPAQMHSARGSKYQVKEGSGLSPPWSLVLGPWSSVSVCVSISLGSHPGSLPGSASLAGSARWRWSLRVGHGQLQRLLWLVACPNPVCHLCYTLKPFNFVAHHIASTNHHSTTTTRTTEQPTTSITTTTAYCSPTTS